MNLLSYKGISKKPSASTENSNSTLGLKNVQDLITT